MKCRWIRTVFAAGMMLVLFAGCGSLSYGQQDKTAAAPEPIPAMAGADAYRESAAQIAAYYAPESDEAWMSEPAEAAAYDLGGGVAGTPTGESSRADTNDKIIYTGNAHVETIRFDETLEQIYDMIERYQGFLESADVTGRDYNSQYYDRYSYRTAQFVIRVPRESFSTLRSDLDMLGSVTYSSVKAQNITTEYRDTQSRLNAYRVEESRLLEMLNKAEYVEDMLNIEDRLSSVRYQIESLTTSLTNWDSMVNYSTMCISVQEVKELTAEKPIARTFGEDLRDGIQSSLDWLGQVGKDIVIFIVSALPILLSLAVLAAVIVWIIFVQRRKKREKTALHQTNDVKVDN